MSMYLAHMLLLLMFGKSGEDFLDQGSKTDLLDGLSKWISDTTSTIVFEEIIDFLWGLGLLVVFVSTIVIGIKYMMVNPNEKSRIKQATTPYIIGVVIIFGAVTIWRLIIDVLDGTFVG